MDGGMGMDTGVYRGKFADHVVGIGAAGTVVNGGAVGSGTDTLASVERLRFDDTAVALDLAGSGGQAYRAGHLLYSAVQQLFTHATQIRGQCALPSC